MSQNPSASARSAGRKTTTFTPESVIQAQIRLALGSDPDVLLWRNAAGVAEHFDAKTATTRKQRFGLAVGACDLIGIVKVPVVLASASGYSEAPHFGRFIGIEVKRPGQEPTEDQERFMRLVQSFGGATVVARSVEEAVEFVARVKCGDL